MKLRIIIPTEVSAMKLCQFEKDRDEQAQCKFTCLISMDFRIVMSTEGSMIEEYQFQKDRDAQGRCGFKFSSINYALCG